MENPGIYEIRVQGTLAAYWSDWFEGLAIQTDPGGDTLIRGPIIDQAALFGVLAKIRDLNMILISVKRLSDP